jgi:hypothetical protein
MTCGSLLSLIAIGVTRGRTSGAGDAMAGGQGFFFRALLLEKFLDLSFASRALERFFFMLAFVV